MPKTEKKKAKKSLIQDTSPENSFFVLDEAGIDVVERFDSEKHAVVKEPGHKAAFRFFRVSGKPNLKRFRPITMTYYVPNDTQKD